MKRLLILAGGLAWLVQAAAAAGAADAAATGPAGWQTAAPREEIRPEFSYDPAGGRDGKGAFRIVHDRRDGLHGFWFKTYAVQGGQFYRFHAVRRAEEVAVPRRSAVARIVWQDDQGRAVPSDRPAPTEYLTGWLPRVEPEHPMDKATDEDGWTEVSDTYRAPLGAARAVVELHLQWAPGGRIEWSDVTFVPTERPPARTARLAAVHYRPRGKSGRCGAAIRRWRPPERARITSTW